MMEESFCDFDRNIGRGDIIGVYDDLEEAISQLESKFGQYKDDPMIYKHESICVIYEMILNKLYSDVNDIFKCVWRHDLKHIKTIL